MATTFLQAMNQVLEVLQEDEIASGATEITSDYHKLIGNFMNQIKEEVEDAHNWRKLRTTQDITISASSPTATITSTTERSRLYYYPDEISGILRPLVVDVTDSGSEQDLVEVDLPQILLMQQLNPSSTTPNSPQYFAIDDTSGDTLDIVVYPTPTTDRTIKITTIDPQAWIETDEISTEITVPIAPIRMGTLWYALEERGEELGVNGLYSEERYRKALDVAISRDAAAQGEYQLVPVQMTRQLQPIDLVAPGFRGLNLSQAGSLLDPSFATRAQNAVVDSAGRLAAREGYSDLTTTDITGTPTVKSLWEYRDGAGTSEYIVAWDGGIGNSITDPEGNDISGSVTDTEGRWWFQNFNGSCIGFQDGQKPIVYTGTGNFATVCRP